jgi:hypothetical protein
MAKDGEGGEQGVEWRRGSAKGEAVGWLGGGRARTWGNLVGKKATEHEGSGSLQAQEGEGGRTGREQAGSAAAEHQRRRTRAGCMRHRSTSNRRHSSMSDKSRKVAHPKAFWITGDQRGQGRTGEENHELEAELASSKRCKISIQSNFIYNSFWIREFGVVDDSSI